MTSGAVKDRLGALLKRRSQASTDEERLATEEELKSMGAEGRTPYQQAEKRPEKGSEYRGS